MAEGNTVTFLLQHPDRDAIGQAIRCLGDRVLQHAVLYAGTEYGGQLQQVAAAILELRGSSQHRIADGSRNPTSGRDDDF